MLKHPAGSGRCMDVAAALLPLALTQDASSTMVRIEPIPHLRPRMRYILPKPSAGACWDFHVTTLTELHAIDTLTGLEGIWASEYLAQHFHYPEALLVVEGTGL